MTAPANQHIELDGGVLEAQVTTLREITAAFAAATDAVAAPLPGDAFGPLAAGLLVPAANALAGRSRELLASARELGDRMTSSTHAALTGFSEVEQNAVDTFSRSEG